MFTTYKLIIAITILNRYNEANNWGSRMFVTPSQTFLPFFSLPSGPRRRRRHHLDGQEPSGSSLHRSVRLHFRRVRRGEADRDDDRSPRDRKHIPTQRLARGSRATAN
jgi:hypothetical protein